MCKNVSSWDVLMKIDESQRSIVQMNQFCMDMTCLFDNLKHSVLDYADNKSEDLYSHNDTLAKETEDKAKEKIDELEKKQEELQQEATQKAEETKKN